MTNPDRIAPVMLDATGFEGLGTKALHDDGTWKIPAGGGTGGGGSISTGSDTSQAGASTAVGDGVTSVLQSTTTITPATDSLIYLTATATASNASGAQGAAVNPVMLEGAASTPSRVAQFTSYRETVETPLSNSALKGTGSAFLKAGVTYRIAYALRTGTGGAGRTVTYTAVQSEYALVPIGGVGGDASALTVQDESVDLELATTLIDFQGEGVEVTSGPAGEVVVTIPGGGGVAGDLDGGTWDTVYNDFIDGGTF